MKCKMTGATSLAGAFVAGMVATTALVGGMATPGAKARGIVAQGQEVIVQRVVNPTITDEDITLLRQDLRAKKMQVIGQNMSLSDMEAERFWPIYNHYVKDLQEVNNQKYALLKQYAEMWATMTDEDIVLLRQDLREMKMQVIGQNMSLSDTEAEKFWPIYNHYVKDLQEVNNQKYALLKQYAEMWATMTDGDALIYVRHWLEADGQAQALRLKYVPVVSQVLPGKKAATFFQLDRRLNMIVDLQLFSQIPLAHVKE